MDATRRWASTLAVVGGFGFLAEFLFVGPYAAIARVRQASPSFLIALQVTAALISSAIIVELFRVCYPKTKAWSTRGHFSAVALVWIVCSVIGLFFLILARRSLGVL
jgi:hypothetical protein